MLQLSRYCLPTLFTPPSQQRTPSLSAHPLFKSVFIFSFSIGIFYCDLHIQSFFKRLQPRNLITFHAFNKQFILANVPQLQYLFRPGDLSGQLHQFFVAYRPCENHLISYWLHFHEKFPDYEIAGYII